jgi:hypothetical protein
LPKSHSLSLNKGIEATKLNPRTGLSLGLPDVSVPYGAFVVPVGTERDRQRFKFLEELYECKREVFLSATGVSKSAAAAPEPEPAVEQAPVAAVPSGPRLEWERVNSSDYSIKRAAVPGGWLVAVNGSTVIFLPDASHLWDGGSVE